MWDVCGQVAAAPGPVWTVRPPEVSPRIAVLDLVSTPASAAGLHELAGLWLSWDVSGRSSSVRLSGGKTTMPTPATEQGVKASKTR
jgi:hypothetical protein